MEPIEPMNRAAKVARRYKDAYLVARATSALGGAVKILALILGAIIALVALIVGAQTNGVFMIIGLLVGAIVTIPLFVLGVLVAAQGQALKASLDEAVHTSPFLTDDERAAVMSL